MADVRVLSFRSTERVFGRDDRIKVLNVDERPWASVCALRIVDEAGDRYEATGWVIGDYTVVTAGHCVYFAERRVWARSIEVYAGMAGSSRQGFSRSQRFRSTRAWSHSEPGATDVGVIVCDEPIGRMVSPLDYSSVSDASLLATTVTVAGYPADRDHGEFQYSDAQRLVRVGASELEYQLDTYGGQSGAPVFAIVGGVRVVVGVHVGSDEGNNTAVRIDPAVASLLSTWRELGPT